MQFEIRPGHSQIILHKLVHGGPAESKAAAKAVIKALDEERTRKFEEKLALQQEARKYFEVLYRPLAELYGKDEKAMQAMRGLWKIQSKLAKRKLVRPIVPIEKPRIISGSMGGVLTPGCLTPMVSTPNVSGNPTVNPLFADDGGNMEFALQTNANNWSNANVTLGLGFLLYSSVIASPTFGNLTITAYPSYQGGYSWTNWLQQGVEATAWIGLNIQQLDLQTGNPLGTVCNNQTFLWNQNNSGGGDGAQEFSSVSFQVVGGCAVDTDHNYFVSLQCGGWIAGGGGPNLFGSSQSSSALTVAVPSISWMIE